MMKGRDSRPLSNGGRGRLEPRIAHGARFLAATVAGREAAARTHCNAALGNGATAAELIEIARMAPLFGGFPRAIQGMRALAAALDGAGLPIPADPEPGRRSRSADRARGAALFRQIYADQSDAVLRRLETPARGFAAVILEDAYGRVLARPLLTAAERELLAVAALIVLDCPAQLASHVRGALRVGATRRQLGAIVAALAGEVPATLLTAARRTIDAT